MTELRQDIGHAIRLLRRAPGFSALAIATLALGIAATTSIFTIVDSVLFRPLRFPEPQQLTMLLPSSGSRLSEEYFHDWRAQSRTFADMAAWYDERANMTGRGEPVEVLVDRVTSNFFDMLRATPLAGRTFTTEPTLGIEPLEVVLSYGFWQRRFGGDSAAIGQTMTIDGEIVTIVGVMPAEFAVRTNELAESRAEIWRPFRLVVKNRSAGMGGMLNVIGRLKPGITPGQGQAELSVIARRIEEQYRSYSSDWFITVVPLLDATVRDVRLMLVVLFGGVAILLVTACVNVANLVLSRSAARTTEFAVRRSLGATSWRLARQLLTEAAVLSILGGAVAIVLAAWGTEVLVSLVPPGLDLPRTREIGVSGKMLLFALVATALTTMFLGLVPTLGSARSAAAALREARGSSSHRPNYAGSALIISEVALALILLAGAGLLSRSFLELARVAPGFHSAQVMTLRVTLPATKYDTDAKIRSFTRDLFERIERLPGVLAVGSVGYLPMSNIGIGDGFEIEGRPPVPPDGDRPTSWINTVGGDYFEAMRIPLVRGRFPNSADDEHTGGVFIIDELLARKYWPNQDPIGARLTWRNDTDNTVRIAGEVIGIVGGVRWAGRVNSAQPTAYFWFPQNPGREINIAARSDGDPAHLAALIAAQVREIDPNQPVGEVRAMENFLSADLARPRFTMSLLGAFASAALLLAAIGLYGVIAFWVTQRTREIGVRVALGAEYSDVLKLVMRRGLLLIGAGLAIGIAATLAFGRVVSGLLYGIKPSDPATLVAASVVLAGVAMLATYVPARRAARVDPLVALRYE